MARTHRNRKAWRRLRQLPPAGQLAAFAAAGLLLWIAANVLVQVARKPTELFYPVASALDKSPAQTWRDYGPIFEEHATGTMTPDLLAALAQVEGAGNPVAHTRWRWRLTEDPFDVYRPASSAVGMYQITDGTFRQARRYCIHDHAVAEDGPWYDPRGCWFNGLYFRVVPTHAVEMTSAFLERNVARVAAGATLRRRQDLAAVMHLCGVAAGEAYAAREFRSAPSRRCGGQDAQAYVAQVRAMQRVFALLAH
jgi:hypothetical protein